MNRTKLSRVALATTGVVVVALAGLTSTPAVADSGAKYYRSQPVCVTPSAGRMGCLAWKRVEVAKGAKGAQKVTPVIDAGPAGGYTPADLAGAYSINPSAATPGQVVGIVDAHDNPDALSDLNAFDAQYGLPAETSTSFRKIGQSGGAPPVNSSPPTDEELGWAGEIALDLDAVRGICHTCQILLVEANSSNLSDLAAAVNTAVAAGATVVSNSYGGAEGTSKGDPQNDETLPQYVAAYNHPGVVITASTGDSGYYDSANYFNPPPSAPGDPSNVSSNAPQGPASYPSVVAVSGTSLQLNDDGTRSSEQVWNSNGFYGSDGLLFGQSLGAAGGGCSTEFNAQPWQVATPNWAQTGCGTRRLTADISALADPYTGYDVFDTYTADPTDPTTDWVTYGGTSLSSPLIAGMFALAGGAHGSANPALALYGNQNGRPGSVYDVTQGGTGVCNGGSVNGCRSFYGQSPNTLGAGILDCAWLPNSETRSAGTRACDAATGYDGASGVGTPIGLKAFSPIDPMAVIKHRKAHVGKKVAFKGNSSTDPYPGGSIIKYQWKVGSGKHARHGHGSKIHVKFKTPGTYKIKLKVYDNYGYVGTKTIKIYVAPAKHHHKKHHHHH